MCALAMRQRLSLRRIFFPTESSLGAEQPQQGLVHDYHHLMQHSRISHGRWLRVVILCSPFCTGSPVDLPSRRGTSTRV